MWCVILCHGGKQLFLLNPLDVYVVTQKYLFLTTIFPLFVLLHFERLIFFQDINPECLFFSRHVANT